MEGVAGSAAIWGILLVASLPPAAGFSSVPAGDSSHDKITEDGAVAAGWEASTAALRAAVRGQDGDEHKHDPTLHDPKRTDASAGYENSHHCVRDPHSDHNAAVLDAVRYIHGEREQALNHSRSGEDSKALDALGRALHALQDCYSHSNIVDMPSSWAAYERMLVDGTNATAPEGLRLASFARDTDEPGMPAGDDYPHDQYAKDGPDHNESKIELEDGRTKYETARDLATNTTAAFLSRVQEEMGADAWSSLQEVEPKPTPERWRIASVGVPAVLVSIGSATLLALAYRTRT